MSFPCLLWLLLSVPLITSLLLLSLFLFHPFACHGTIFNLLCICAPHTSAWACHLHPLTSQPPHHFFLSYVGLGFFSASATCVVAMFLCLYISEHLLSQQGPHGLKCQSKQLPDKCIVQQACVSPPPVPPLLVMWCKLWLKVSRQQQARSDKEKGLLGAF